MNKLPKDLLEQLKTVKVDGSIAVQARESFEETNMLLKFAEDNDHVVGVVGWVDLLNSDQLEKDLEQWKDNKNLCGFREILQGKDPQFMLGEKFIKNLKLIHSHNYSYDILVFPKHLEAVLKLIPQLPKDMRLVIDHIAKPEMKLWDKSGEDFKNWEANMKAIGKH